MAISTFDLFSIGIGPSSSHTVGPMRAAKRFINCLKAELQLSEIGYVKIDLYGSLALTGKGHATDVAVMLGLEGESPEDIDPDQIPIKIDKIRQSGSLLLDGRKQIPFFEKNQMIFHKDKQLPYHPNGMRFTAYGPTGEEKLQKIYYSIGGGFIVDHDVAHYDRKLVINEHSLPFPFKSGADLLALCKKEGLSIAELMMKNEMSWRPENQVLEGIFKIWGVMKSCIERGCQADGVLPGGLNVRRRAKGILHKLIRDEHEGKIHPSAVLEWVSLWALAVNEENAAGGRVVTAPTNGAAGVIPAVANYYLRFTQNSNDEGIIKYFLTAAGIGILYKEGASISAAEMGCMGEVGVACSMAAAGLTAALGGSAEQVENAAEIGMEHNLGLTCDPIMGLVQIPCIERNTMGAVKAINAALLALRGDGKHRVSIDQVIASMRQTGDDMKSIYKETGLGGLAVNVPEC